MKNVLQWFSEGIKPKEVRELSQVSKVGQSARRAKSRTVDSILFEKENDFCTTFGSAYGRLTLRQLAYFA